jgi:NAD-dependent histone deacetylase SIR2
MEKLQDEAREMGLMKFIEKYVIQQSVPIPKILEAFNIYMVKNIFMHFKFCY